MERVYAKPEKLNIKQLDELVRKLNLSGFCGVATRDQELVLVFDERDDLTTSEKKKVDSLLKNYSFVPELLDIRLDRKPLLLEADWRINKAEDMGEDTVELRKYRQALRDITSQDLSDLKWPEKPWE